MPTWNSLTDDAEPVFLSADGSFLSAVRAKYDHKQGSTEGGELVGGDKTGSKQALDKLTRVFVREAAIAHAGPAGEIAATCGAIQELDIGGNLIDAWEPVIAIATQCTSLRWLGLDRLKLAPVDAPPTGFADALGGLRTLCLSGTGMAWDQLLMLAPSLPRLEELHFSDNGLEALVPTAGDDDGSGGVASLGGVREIYLEGNRLASWEAIAPLSRLAALEVLNLNHNRLSSVPPPADGAFSSLRHLMLRGNPLSEWASVDALDRFPSLHELRLAETPLTSSMPGAASRRTLIARVARLVALNGSEVRPREREDAERFYLRQVALSYPEGGLPADAIRQEGGDEVREEAAGGDAGADTAEVDEYGRPVWKKAAAAKPTDAGRAVSAARQVLTVPEGEGWAALQAAHPRWASLLVEHGSHVTASAATTSGGVIANELIEVSMACLAAESAHLPKQTRKLPGGLPLKAIKTIAFQLYKVEPTRQRLMYSPPGQEGDIPELLDDETRSLADLGVVSGGTIVVDEELTGSEPNHNINTKSSTT